MHAAGYLNTMDIKFDTPTLIYSSKRDEVLLTLKDRFTINFFHFARRFKDSEAFSISTNKDWHIKYKEEYECVDTFMDSKKIKQYKNIYLWGSEGFNTKKERKMHDERTKSFAIPPGISLMNETEHYVDTYSFSTSLIFQDRINVLLNESNSLYQFGLEFSKNLNPIITEYTKKNLLLINNMTIKPIIPNKIIEINNALQLAKQPNLSNQTTIYDIFTQRQIECIYCAAQGLNSQQTGTVLNISKRTVESTLNGSMIKLNCINKNQLIYCSTKYGLIRDDLISQRIKNTINGELLKIM